MKIAKQKLQIAQEQLTHDPEIVQNLPGNGFMFPALHLVKDAFSKTMFYPTKNVLETTSILVRFTPPHQ